MEEKKIIAMHNKYAPYWAASMAALLLIGLLVSSLNLGVFSKSYVLDMVGPAWAYILFRGLFTAKANNRWTRFFTPNKTIIIFLIVSFGFETLQYFKVYESTFDVFDLLAYISILVPLYLIDNC